MRPMELSQLPQATCMKVELAVHECGLYYETVEAKVLHSGSAWHGTDMSQWVVLVQVCGV